MDLEAIQRAVENDIEIYVYVVTDAIGNAWTDARVEAELAAMRAALIAPYWAEVELRESYEQVTSCRAPSRTCAVVADDSRGNLVAFDPIENEFLLLETRAHKLYSAGIRGDSVGCFMAR